MKTNYIGIGSDRCEVCQQKECHLLCGKLQERFDKTWRETYNRKSKHEIINGRLERIN